MGNYLCECVRALTLLIQIYFSIRGFDQITSCLVKDWNHLIRIKLTDENAFAQTIPEYR